ncbi:MAG: tetratricopeptide repeat protein [Candidatus Thermoplasmatota archaeon]|nr:tetratricopeptide repeat protein [Candidatus Thermoplasmatota archaeon]
MAEKNNKALGRGISALFKKEKREERTTEVEPEGSNFEFYGSLMKKYIQSGSKDPMIAQMLEEIREHLGISPEEHMHMMETLRKREEARQVWTDKEDWEKEHGGLQNELKDMFKSYVSGSETSPSRRTSDMDVIEGPGAIALMERNPTVVLEGGDEVITVPPHDRSDQDATGDLTGPKADQTTKDEAEDEFSVEDLPELDEVIEDIEEGIEGVNPETARMTEEAQLEPPPVTIKASQGTVLDLRSLMEAGDMIGAMDMVQKLLEEDPRSTTLLNEKGVILYNMDRLSESVECYRDALAIEPDSPELNINYSIALSGIGDVDASIKHLDRAIDKDPYNEEAWNNKAVILTKMGRLRDALNCLDESIRINEGSPTAWHNTAVILERMGDYGTALECYSKVVQIDPDNVAAIEGMSYCEGRLNRSN